MIPAQTGIHVIFSCGVSSYSDQAVIVSFTDFYRKLKKFYINLFENLFLFENENRTRTKKILIFANKNRTRTKNILNAANENRTRTKKISVFFHPWLTNSSFFSKYDLSILVSVFSNFAGFDLRGL